MSDVAVPEKAVRADDPVAPGATAGHASGGAVLIAWREMTARHAVACAALERELGQRHGLGLSEFEVLERLAEHAEHKYRAQELAEAVHLSQSALSRLVDRLAKDGLVERCVCDMDRRGIFIVLTMAGARRHLEAMPTHRAVLGQVMVMSASA